MNRREFLKGAAVGAVLPFAAGAKAAEGLPVAGTYDLVVAGGSSTGVCAAVTAARHVAGMLKPAGARPNYCT